MDSKTIIKKLAQYMRQYQKENGIEKNCATNVQLLYDMIETNQFCKAKVKAVLVFSEDKNDIVATSYLVIELYDGTVIDPSYDTYSLKILWISLMESLKLKTKSISIKLYPSMLIM